MGKKEQTSLNWDDFIKLGNPENAPDLPEEVEEVDRSKMQIRLHYEKKGRGGKEAVIIRGIEESDIGIKDICKTLKTKLGVGGNAKNGEIVIQGKNRDKMIDILKNLGFVDVKKSGG